MGTLGPARTLTFDDPLAIFDATAGPDTPLAVAVTADRSGGAPRTAHRALERLDDAGELRSKAVGARSLDWGAPPAAGRDAGRTGGAGAVGRIERPCQFDPGRRTGSRRRHDGRNWIPPMG